MKMLRYGATAAIVAGAAVFLGSVPAGAVENGTVSNAAWVVSVGGTTPDGWAYCSGTALNESWVLTAGHCPDIDDTVRYPTGINGQYGEYVAVDKVVESPNADIQLVHLATPHRLKAYPPIDLGYTPVAGDTGFNFGLGSPNGGEQRRLQSKVIGGGEDTVKGKAVVVADIDGANAGGDSGGPLVVNGKVVGVLSWNTIETDHSKQRYGFSNLRNAVAMIAGRTIGSIDFADNRASIEVGNDFLTANDQLVAYVNGQYAGSVSGGSAYYSSRQENTARNTYTWSFAAAAGDSVKIARVAVGANVDIANADILTSTLAGKIMSITTSSGRPVLAVANSLVDWKHTVLWVNGAYVGEADNGSVYYLSSSRSGGITRLMSDAPVPPGSTAELTLVPGKYPTPEGSETVYSAVVF